MPLADVCLLVSYTQPTDRIAQEKVPAFLDLVVAMTEGWCINSLTVWSLRLAGQSPVAGDDYSPHIKNTRFRNWDLR